MTIYKELEYTTNVDKVCGVQFGILGPEDIKKRSTVEITTQETFIGNEPVIGGLFDPRMGVIDNGKVCKTCEQRNNFCNGHFGHLVLAKPVFYYHFIPMIIKILKCVCVRCSKLLFSSDMDEVKQILKKKSGKSRWTVLSVLGSKIKVCGAHNDCGCGAEQPEKITKDGLNKINVEWKGDPEKLKSIQMSAELILKIFSRMSDTDCEILGFSRHWCRPDWMICSVLSIPPPCVRPSVRQDNNQRMEDDLTHKLIDIIKTNKTIMHKIENNANAQVIDEWTSVLQYHIATLVDNEIPGIAPACQRSGRPLKSIRQRLKSKEGRIRGNLMGKRVDYSARSVITPDPGIGIDELGVPIKIASNLTYPEIVTPYNIERLYKMVKNGPYNHPGAKTLKRQDKSMISLKHVVTQDIVLEYGDIVNRHLIDGDVVLFNRQPSLHRMSMMAHKVKVMEGSTFRLNVSVTSPYNADFDGDEMNMHVPQSISAQTELLNLAYVPYQIVSPRENKPCISIVQDTLLGVNRLTRSNVSMTLKDSMNMICWNDGYSSKLLDYMDKEVTGINMFSSILPNINLRMGNKQYDMDDGETSNNFIVMEKGMLKQGRLDKDIFSKSSRGLIHTIYNDYGENTAKDFLNNIQYLVNQYLLNTGFSVGISDLIADKNTNSKMKKEIQDKKMQVNKVIEHLHLNVFENFSGKTNNMEFESRVNKILNEASSKVGKVGVQSLTANNRMTTMVKAGSKGNDINIAQMVSCLGQQNVDGKRIPYGFTDRTLPHYHKYDDGAESRGFVENSFINGLNPQEFFFHAMGGREGLIDTAVKTSETGYIQRKLMKAMEDLRVGYDITVRNAVNGIVQFVYGDDGIDAIKIESIGVNNICETNFQKYSDMYLFDDFDNVKKWSYLEKSMIKEMTQDKQWKQHLLQHFSELVEYRKMMINDVFNGKPNNSICCPITINRILNNAKNHFNITKNTVSDLNPLYVLKKIEEVKEKIQIKRENILYSIVVSHNLSPKYLIKTHHITKNAFEYIVEQIYNKFNNAIVNPGEMVGAISAQSLGEPATQMTLNTFHLAGVSSKSNVTRGVPRLKEILHISKSPKNPSLTVYLNDEISNVKNPKSKEKSKEVLYKMELTRIKDIAISTSIYFDPIDSMGSLIQDDIELIQLYEEFKEILEEDCVQEGQSPWVLRIEFDRRKMNNKNIQMEDIYYAIKSVYEGDVSCIYSDDNSNKLIFRIRISQHNEGKEYNDDMKLLKTLDKNIMNKIVLRGIEGINKVTMRVVDNEDGYFDTNGDFIQNSYWVLDTEGNNLIDTLCLPEVNSQKTFSNDIYEIMDTLGIEAARQILMNELNIVIEEHYVNYRHVSLLVDIMTFRGYLMSIDRHGINRSEIGPLAKCSFEETTDQLLKAAMFGETDKMSGISANIMLGQVAPCGTGLTDVLLDENRLGELYSPMDEKEVETPIVEKEVMSCSSSKLQLNFNFENIDPNPKDYIHPIVWTIVQ